MNLEQFAKKAGVELVDVGPQWGGGRLGYKESDHPNSVVCGFRTSGGAYKHWLQSTFGKNTAKAVLKLLTP
jgi:hypothetical protein